MGSGLSAPPALSSSGPGEGHRLTLQCPCPYPIPPAAAPEYFGFSLGCGTRPCSGCWWLQETEPRSDVGVLLGLQRTREPSLQDALGALAHPRSLVLLPSLRILVRFLGG